MDECLFVLLLLSGLFWSSSALSRQYHYINVNMSWSEAQSYCRARFTDLATVETMNDLNRLRNTVGAAYSGSVWIGLKRGTQQRWGWSNGEDTLAQYSAWDTEHPNSEGECSYLAFGVWYSYSCSSYLYFVCYNENTGYLRVQEWKNWTDAESYCRKYHTDLVTIHNTEEQDQLNSMIPPESWVWIGLFRDSWQWSDNWSGFFRYWADDQPSDQVGSGDCVGMTAVDFGKWIHESCDLQRPFICFGDEVNRKQIVRLKFSCKEKCTLNGPSLQTAILNEISAQLESLGLESDSKISWRKGEDEEVFHEENEFK